MILIIQVDTCIIGSVLMTKDCPYNEGLIQSLYEKWRKENPHGHDPDSAFIDWLVRTQADIGIRPNTTPFEIVSI